MLGSGHYPERSGLSYYVEWSSIVYNFEHVNSYHNLPLKAPQGCTRGRLKAKMSFVLRSWLIAKEYTRPDVAREEV